MKNSKSSISKASNYEVMGDFWDKHDVTRYQSKRGKVDFIVDIKSEKTYYGVDQVLAEEVQSLAEKRGVSAATLLNLWIQQKLVEVNSTLSRKPKVRIAG